MKRQLALAAALLLPGLALANGEELSAMKQKNLLLGTQADTCVLLARTAFVKLRAGSSPADEQRDVEKCIADGKDSAKEAHTEIRTKYKKKQPPTELTDWRLEWMAAFDATALKTGETESQYLRRAQEARSKVERATNKFEVATE